MKAVRFHYSIPRYLLSRTWGIVTKRAYSGRLSALRYEDVPEPTPPNEHWVKVKTAFCGICSSDLTTIFLKGNLDSPLTPFVSFPMILGHEIVGEIVEIGRAVKDLALGDRVVVDPLLCCRTRDIAPICPSCREGHYALCQNFAEGSLPAGLLLGANSGVGGGWAPILVAHKTQCLKIPDGIPFEEAVLTDPFAVALHALLSHPPQEGDAVLIIGGGTLGLCAVQGVRALYPQSKILVVAKYDFQRDLALRVSVRLIVVSLDQWSNGPYLLAFDKHNYQILGYLTLFSTPPKKCNKNK